jgi:H+/Cl- antiporter ClcA
MSNLLWVLVPLLVSIVIGAVLVYRARKPQSLEHGIDEFQRELRALAPRRNEEGPGAG